MPTAKPPISAYRTPAASRARAVSISAPNLSGSGCMLVSLPPECAISRRSRALSLEISAITAARVSMPRGYQSVPFQRKMMIRRADCPPWGVAVSAGSRDNGPARWPSRVCTWTRGPGVAGTTAPSIVEVTEHEVLVLARRGGGCIVRGVRGTGARATRRRPGLQERRPRLAAQSRRTSDPRGWTEFRLRAAGQPQRNRPRRQDAGRHQAAAGRRLHDQGLLQGQGPL